MAGASPVIYQANTIIEKVKFTREAAAVSRCHTVPTIGDYPVGGHSFNMLTMLRILWPDAPIALVWAILEHDIPERLTGDIPAPTKWFKIVSKDELTIAEMEINTAIFGEDTVQKLSDEELRWLSGLDILELYMFCRDQIMLGNRNLEVMARRIERFVKNNTHRFATAVVDLFWECRDSEWEMMPDLGDKDV